MTVTQKSSWQQCFFLHVHVGVAFPSYIKLLTI